MSDPEKAVVARSFLSQATKPVPVLSADATGEAARPSHRLRAATSRAQHGRDPLEDAMGRGWAHMASGPTLARSTAPSTWPQRRPPGHSCRRRSHAHSRAPGALQGPRSLSCDHQPLQDVQGQEWMSWYWPDVSPMCTGPGCLGHLPPVAEDSGPSAMQPQLSAASAAAPREVPQQRRRADCNIACESCPVTLRTAGTQATRLALCGCRGEGSG